MLCSKCYKKIPEGQEVAKTTGFWKVNGWGRWGNEIFCKKCAKEQDKNDRVFFIVFFSIWFFVVISILIFFLIKKN